MQQLCAALQLPQPSVTRLLAAYPAALDMAPATVAARAAALAATLQLPQDAALAVACKCPRLLGLSPQSLQDKLHKLQAALQLPSVEAAVEIVVGFPALLGLSSITLEFKWRRLQELAGRKDAWKQQLAQLLQQRGAGSLGRVLAAGPGVVERLQYVLDAQINGHSNDSNSLQDDDAGQPGDGTSSSSGEGSEEGAGDDGLGSAGAAAAAAAAAGRGAGELRLTTLLLQSEALFTARHPEFVLWRLNQRSRPASSSSSRPASSSSSRPASSGGGGAL